MDADTRVFVTACLPLTFHPTMTPASSQPPLVTHHLGLCHWSNPLARERNYPYHSRCLSKAIHFVALPKLLMAREITNLLVSNVFQLHGIPQDKGGYRGLQFISQVWKAFCNALGATVSLFSEFHPRSMVRWSEPIRS